MRELSDTEQRQVDGGFAPIALFAEKLAWAGFKHWRTLKKARLAAQATGHLGTMAAVSGGSYAGMRTLDSYISDR